MKPSTAFVLGFVTAFALPTTRAIITGIQMGICEARDDWETKRKIAQYPLQSVN